MQVQYSKYFKTNKFFLIFIERKCYFAIIYFKNLLKMINFKLIKRFFPGKNIKNIGFSKDIEGIYTRFLNEGNNWTEHLENTKKSILISSQNKNKDLCVVLGSGWWLDIPVQELSQMFKRLVLVDIVHPSQIKHKAQKYSNIELIEIEITGIGNKIFNVDSSSSLNDLIVSTSIAKDFNLSFYNDIDYLVSANLLSQLTVFFEKYLNQKKRFSLSEVNNFAKLIQQNHLDSLPKGKSCLIADYFEKFYDNNNQILHQGKRIYVDLPEKGNKNEWIWKFDLKGNYKFGKKVYFDVKFLDV